MGLLPQQIHVSQLQGEGMRGKWCLQAMTGLSDAAAPDACAASPTDSVLLKTEVASEARKASAAVTSRSPAEMKQQLPEDHDQLLPAGALDVIMPARQHGHVDNAIADRTAADHVVHQYDRGAQPTSQQRTDSTQAAPEVR